jgi:hypothetical protein
MTVQTTLLTSHKGVDLHAATAVRVMRHRLADGDALRALHRCELHTFWGEGDGRTVAELLDVGRYFNPNKHHHGHFTSATPAAAWADEALVGGTELPADWPGEAVAGDLPAEGVTLYDALLGGPVPDDLVAVDLVTLPLGETAAVRSGVLWRLVLATEGRDPARLAERLAVVRRGDQGLLVNPHLHGWLARVRRA